MHNCINFPEVYAPLSNCFDFVKNNHFYPTRHATKGAIKLPFPKPEHYKQCIAFLMPKSGTASMIYTFKNRLSKYILNLSDTKL